MPMMSKRLVTEKTHLDGVVLNLDADSFPVTFSDVLVDAQCHKKAKGYRYESHLLGIVQ